MIYAAPGTAFEASTDPIASGGTIAFRILDGVGGTTVARTTSGVVETPIGNSLSVYSRTTTLGTVGQYVITWDDGAGNAAAESVNVLASTSINVVSGSFTYDPTTSLGQLRLQIGDTDSTSPLFTDQEANVYLNNRGGNILAAAADLCDVLAARFAVEFDFETDQQRFQRSQRSKQYAELAKTLRIRAAGGVASVASSRVDGYTQDVDSEAMVTSVSAGTGRVRQGYFDGDVPY